MRTMMSEPVPSSSEGQGQSKLFVIALAVVALAVAAYFALGMPGMDHGGPGPSVDHEQMER